MKINIISFTKNGYELSKKMRAVLAENEVLLYTTKKENGYEEAASVSEGLNAWCEAGFKSADAIIFIGAAGIAVRTIAPFIESKTSDPAVIVADEKGEHIISLLSGHLGGGNELTKDLAEKLGSDPVITTASDVNGKLAIDVWAKKNGLFITDMKKAKDVAARIVEGKPVLLYCEGEISCAVPKELTITDEMNNAHIIVSPFNADTDALHLVPKAVIVGMGCKKDKEYAVIKEQFEKAADMAGIHKAAVEKLVSIDIKKEEQGLKGLAKELDIPFITYSAEQLSDLPGEYTASGFVSSVTGVDNVCERSAAAGLKAEEQENADFLLRKFAENGVTIAMTQKKWRVSFE